jgi:Uncharacterized protein conserved in bacteria
MSKSGYKSVVGLMPKSVAEKLSLLDGAAAAGATEIRMRAAKPCTVYSGGRPHFIKNNGEDMILGQNEIKAVVAHMCEYSLYKKEDELKHGYVTVKGGHRIGICATYLKNGGVDISSISSAAIRIAREHRGCAAELFGAVMMNGLCSILVAGPPLCGKTTILRDISRILSSRPIYKKTAVIDERGELASVYNGTPMLDTGTCSDVLDGYPRAAGFDIAVRTLSPDIIVCDELGGREDAGSILGAAKSGVDVIASAHAGNMQELMQKKQITECIDAGAFDYIVFLDTFQNIGRIKDIYKVVNA